MESETAAIRRQLKELLEDLKTLNETDRRSEHLEAIKKLQEADLWLLQSLIEKERVIRREENH